MGQAWHAYWAWVGGNIGAMPLQAFITAVVGFAATVLLRPLIRRLWAWVKRELNRPALEEAKAARKIAADLYMHHTGRPHPDAPGQTRTSSDATKGLK
jgi:hypothetical protein